MLWPETEVVRICRKLFGKFVKWQQGNFIFLAGFSHLNPLWRAVRTLSDPSSSSWGLMVSREELSTTSVVLASTASKIFCDSVCYLLLCHIFSAVKKKLPKQDIFGFTHIHIEIDLYISCYGPIGVVWFKRQVALLLITKSAAQIQM